VLRMTEIISLKDVYSFQLGFATPYFFDISFEDWRKSFENDIDGEGRKLFKEWKVKVVYDGNELVGFVQYGKTAFGFDDRGRISKEVSYPIIRNLYFLKGREDAGLLLLNETLESFKLEERVYAFFHYFGMSCFARHGKLFEQHTHIENLLTKNGFKIEHENVYYSSVLNDSENSHVVIVAKDLTKGNQQSIAFKIDDVQVGGCELHYLNDATAYLRWIYVNSDIVGQGIGTKCMNALKCFLYKKGIRRFDTDTAVNNVVAQHYYEKNNFNREGITRSYYFTNVMQCRLLNDANT